MRRLTALIASLIITIVFIGYAEAKTVTFKLDPSDPHWVKKVDPSGVLQDLGYAWKSSSTTVDTRPEIYFKLPEVSSSKGILTFTWSKEESPDYIGWDSVEGVTPTPTPTPTPTTPAPTPTKPIPGFEVAYALAGLVALAYMLGRRCS